MKRKILFYLEKFAKQFEDIPHKADPSFYHTLSEDGDIKEQKRINNLIKEVKKLL